MSRRSVLLLVAVLATIAPVGPVGQSAVASTGDCPGSYNYDFISDAWFPSNVAGFRAPIELRRNGDVCNGGGFTANWVGVFGNSGNGSISQIGWTHSDGWGHCRFFYWDDGNGNSSGWHFSRCDASTGTVRLYKVEDTKVSGTHYYSIYDCGTSAWGNCSTVDDGPARSGFDNEAAGVYAEAPYGQNCHDVAMGSSGNPVVFGGSQGDIEGMLNYDGSYSTRTLSDANGACSDYDWGVHNNVKLTTFDDRN